MRLLGFMPACKDDYKNISEIYALIYSPEYSFYSIYHLYQFIHDPSGYVLIAISDNLDELIIMKKQKIQQQKQQPANEQSTRKVRESQ